MRKRTQWAKAKEIASRAFERPPEERGAFLNEACQADPALRACVDGFVLGGEDDENFLRPPATTTLDQLTDEFLCPALVGRRLGPYLVTDVIASGGMGTVYRAQRADDAFEKDVAVKVIHRSVSSGRMAQRIQNERQLLASLEHPLITRLIDGGTTEEGLPYLVMEYVDGERIDQYCDRLRLTIRARLELFGQVCDAVHYAHQNLVVHRDLKPGNILVTSEGHPKLLDFGVAKLLEEPATSSALHGLAAVRDATITLCRMLTPQYASPEQIRGEPVTTATDVYSLGIVLYELLSGHHPFDVHSRSGYERERLICEVDPPLPSSVVSRVTGVAACGDATDCGEGAAGSATALQPERIAMLRGQRPVPLRRRLRGDLDNIILTAMRKDPRQRFASVRELSNDIRRYLDGIPINARRHTLAYRASRMIKRNKGASFIVFVAALSLITGIIGASLGLARARQAEREAKFERQFALQAQAETEAGSAFLQSVLSAANPFRKGRDATVLELLEDAAGRIDRELASQPGVEASVRYAIANTYAGMWLWRKAIPHLRIALGINRKQYGNEHPRVAECLSLLGRALTFARDSDSVGIQREGLAIRRRRFGENHPLVAESLGNLAYALWHGVPQPRWAEAEAKYRQAIAILKRAGDSYRRDLARFTFSLAVMLQQIHRNEDSEKFFLEALALYRQLPSTEDRYTIECINKYAALLQSSGRIEEAESLLRDALARAPEDVVLGVRHQILWRLATLRHAQKDLLGADRYYRNALAIHCQCASIACPDRSQQFAAFAAELSVTDRVMDAGPLLVESLTALVSVSESYDPSLAAQTRDIARLFCDRRAFDRAENLLRQCLAYQRRNLPSGHYQIAVTQNMLGGCLTAQRRFVQAEPLLVESLPVLRSALHENHSAVRLARRRLAELYQAWGRPPSASGVRVGD